MRLMEGMAKNTKVVLRMMKVMSMMNGMIKDAKVWEMLEQMSMETGMMMGS